jgi:hypothetical protein
MSGGAGGDHPCVSCGRPADPGRACPHCGHVPSAIDAELANVERAIAEMAAADVRLERERKNLSSDLQAAMHQRAVLAHAVAQRDRQTQGRTRRPGRRGPRGGEAARGPVAAAPPAAGVTAPPRPERPIRPPRTGQPPPRTRVAPPPPPPPPPPEASSRSVQTVLLSLGALLIGIAAVVFVGVAITTLDAWNQVVILLAATAAALAIAPAVARRGLTATAETVAAVGLILVAVVGYALWRTDAVAAVPGPTFAGIVAGTVAGVSYGYRRLTGLAVPRYAATVALQPVLPLLAYPWVTGPAGWSLIFSLVAAQDAVLGHLDQRRVAVRRPLRHLAWLCHGVALGAAIAWAIAALAQATDPASAVRGALSLIFATAVGLAGALSLRRAPLPDLAAGLLSLAVIGSAWRVAAVTLPGRALLPLTAVVAATALMVRLLPARARRGPQLAVAAALAVIGTVVAALALRAGAATVRAVLPAWSYPDQPGVPAVAGGTPAQLAVAAALLTLAALAAAPAPVRREWAAIGAALTAIATPATFGLSPVLSPWLLVIVAAGLGVTGLDARTRRAAAVHVGAAAVVGLMAAGAALATPVLTAGVLATITLVGVTIAGSRARSTAAVLVNEWAAGAAAVALPGAIATGLAAAGGEPPVVLAAAFVAVCGTLGYAAITQVARRVIPVPVTMGAGLGALAVAVAAVQAPQGTPTDLGVALLLLLGAVLIVFSPRVDAARRADRMLDGADIAAAAVTAATVASLARAATLLLPAPGMGGAIAVGATLVLVVTVGVRALPRQWRRGPSLGVAVAGAAVAVAAGWVAATAGLRVLAFPGALWQADLTQWPPSLALAGVTWQAPYALVLLALAAAAVLPRPASHDVSAGLGVLAAIGTPIGVGLDWWGPIAISVAAATGYALAAAVAVAPRAGLARAGAAGALALYAVGASLVRPWTTAAVLAILALVAVVVAALVAMLREATLAEAVPEEGVAGERGGIVAGGTDPDQRDPGVRAETSLRTPVGGFAVVAALLAVPGSLAALAATLEHPTRLVLAAALAGSSLGLALLAMVRRAAPQYLSYGTIGVAGGATGTALLSLPAGYPTGVYAGAAALMAVLAELMRAGHRPAGPSSRWSVRPQLGALVASAVPALLALAAVAPALGAALIDPFQVLAAPWDGPPAVLTDPAARPDVQPTSVVAALLLTLAAALAAVGFGGAVSRQVVPVILPGLAVTMLITPPALGVPWPAATVAALGVFTIAMLGVAWTPPPPATLRGRPLRVTRVLVLVIGLAAGNAGLLGSLADPELTWATLGGAVAVGAGAAWGGRTEAARICGWLGAAVAAELFALNTAVLLGATRQQAAFGVLAVGAVALLLAARLPRLRSPAAYRELAAVEWTGYASLLLALAFAFDSPSHLAGLLIGWGAVLGIAALRPGRSDRWRLSLLWAAAACEVIAWWIIMWLNEVSVLEAYTLPFAAFALLVGVVEARYRPELGSWGAYGPALVAALAPSLAGVLTTGDPEPLRQGWVLVGSVGALILGSLRRQRAPVIVGTVVTIAAALQLLSQLAGPWLMLIPIGLILLILGANNERRQRDLERIRGALDRMR